MSRSAPPKHIVVFGRPGSGKSSLAERLNRDYGYLLIRTGELLRDAIRRDDFLGKRVAIHLETGSLVPDPLIFELLEQDLKAPGESRLLFDGFQSRLATGIVSSPAFLIDLEAAFERYLERGLRAHFGERLESQRVFCYHRPVPAGQPTLTARPDFVLRDGGQVRCAIDAKWKLLDGPPPAADVHQALAYAAGLGCGDVRLVYPGRRSSAWRYELAANSLRLTVHTVRVVGTREKCAQALHRFTQALA